MILAARATLPMTILLVARWAWQRARPLAAGPDSSDCVCTPALLAASGGRSARARPTRPSGDVMAAHGYTHVLDLGRYLKAVFPAFASGARGLHPAERLAQVAHVLAVDEDHPGLDAACQAMGLADVLGPDVGGQAVFHVVGQAQRLGFVLERDQADHRAEDLLLGDAHAVVHVGEHRGLDELPLLRCAGRYWPDAPGRRPPGWRLPRGRCGCSR